MSQKLLTDAIGVLQASKHNHSQNPTIYRLLGDRYLQAGLVDKAKTEYTTASSLAQKKDNPTELAKANDGLKQVKLYSQSPKL